MKQPGKSPHTTQASMPTKFMFLVAQASLRSQRANASIQKMIPRSFRRLVQSAGKGQAPHDQRRLTSLSHRCRRTSSFFACQTPLRHVCISTDMTAVIRTCLHSLTCNVRAAVIPAHRPSDNCDLSRQSAKYVDPPWTSRATTKL